MIKRTILCAAIAATLTITGCGGGSDGGTSKPTDRIEPLDTAKLKSSAQTQAEPVAVSRMPKGAAVARIALGPFAGAKMSLSQNNNTSAPLQIGQGRVVPATASPQDLAGKLQWNTLADGTQVAALAFSAEGARAIRLGVLARRVPAGAVLRFYGEDGADVVEKTSAQLEQLRQINEGGGLVGDDARMVWGPVTAGAVSMLEVQLPAGADASQLQLAVPQLSHLTQTVQQTLAGPEVPTEIGASGSCNLDVTCNADLQAESRSVAKMVFTSGGSSYLCSGTLMNDAKGSLTLYFLTANHCLSTQAEASSLITYWFFRAASCGSSLLNSAAKYSATGAKLLYTEKTSDATLLQLNGPIPVESGVVYAGSYFGSGLTTGTSVVDVHHPSGDMQKYSVGGVTGYATCTLAGNGYFSCAPASSSTGQMYEVGWTQGTVEPGSSGSALLVKQGNTRYVTGMLNSGTPGCSAPPGSKYYYGRFDLAYSRGIKAYLNP